MSEKEQWSSEERRRSFQSEIDRIDAGQLHIITRLDAQDSVLKDIRTILVVGKWGWTIFRTLIVLGAAVIGALAAWKSIK